MKNALAFLALLLAACGSTTASTPDGAGDACAGFGPNDACINEENLAQCRAREAECPGQVLVLESCPLQFACP